MAFSTKRPYDATLGASEASLIEGLPLPQAIVTVNCFIDNRDMKERFDGTKPPGVDYLYPGVTARNMNEDSVRLNVHEIALTYNDPISHAPIVYNMRWPFQGVEANNQLREQQRIYNGVINTKGFKNIFTTLNRVWVRLPPNDQSPEGNHMALMRAFYNMLIEPPNGALHVLNQKAGMQYFPPTLEELLAHFAFRSVGLTKIDQNANGIAAISGVVGGVWMARATEPIPAFTEVEWYLIPREQVEDGETRLTTEYKSILSTGKLSTQDGRTTTNKVLVGLRPRLEYSGVDIMAQVRGAYNEEDTGMNNALNDLSMYLDLFQKSRVIGRSLSIATKGEKCTILVGRGGYSM